MRAAPGRSAPSSAPRPSARPSTPTNRPQSRPAANVALRVSTKSEKDEIGIQTLVGDYCEKGSNHGRKYYQKAQKIVGHEDVQVFLYYWDTRDGPDFCGWWFGDQVGGSQVWSRASAHSQTPPPTGWRVPWDGPVTNNLLHIEHLGQVVKPAMVKTESGAASSGERVQLATEMVTGIEADVRMALKGAKEAMEDEITGDTIQEIEATIRAQQTAVGEAQKGLAQDINEARMNGESLATVTALSKLSPRLRTLTSTLASEKAKLKAQFGKLQRSAEETRRRHNLDERQQQVESRDAKGLQEALPLVMEMVSQAEDEVEAVAIMSDQLEADSESLGDHAGQTMRDIEQAAAKASNTLTEARKQINTKMQDSKKYAPEARQVAHQEYSALQQKLTEAMTRLQPLKQIRQEYDSKVSAKKSMDQIVDKLGDAELEVEKAAIMCSAGIDGQMSEDEIRSAMDILGPAQAEITAAAQLVEKKLKAAEGSSRKELLALQRRTKDSRAKLDEARAGLRTQREGLSSQQMLEQAHEKVERAEEAMIKASEAEMPFLRGIEVLPREEALQAVSESETAAASAEVVVTAARTYVKAKLADTKRYSKDVAQKVSNELTDMQARVQLTLEKLSAFKKETSSRKTNVFLQDLIEKITEAEAQVQMLAEVAKLFSSETLDEASTESLKATSEQSAIAERDASSACADARKLLSTKQRDAKDAAMVGELSKLQARLNASMTEMKKHQKASQDGERLIKSKEVYTTEEDKIKGVEEEVLKAETLATPLGDERLSDEKIKQIDAAVNSAQLQLTKAVRSVDSQLSGSVAQMKAALSKLIIRAKKAQEKLDSVKATTKEQRERVASDSYVKEATKKTDMVDQALAKVDKAEGPFLKGVETIPLKDAQKALAESEAAAEQVQRLIGEARTFIAGKTLEVRRFAGNVAKPTSEHFAKLTERVNAAALKVSQFRKDTESRKRTILMQEAAQRLTDVEKAVAKTTAAAAPLATQDVDKLSASAATDVCEKLAALESDATTKMNEARTFLSERQKDARGSSAHEEQLKKLQSRMAAVQVELTKAKKTASEHEQKFVAKKLLTEASDMVKEVENEVEKVTVTSAPLIKDNGDEFLVANNLLLITEALKEQISKGGATEKALFAEANGGKDGGKISAEAFKHFLEKIPEKTGREDLTFSDDQRGTMFKHVDADKDGKISAAEFGKLFSERFVCRNAISITDGFDISSSNTLGKLELDEVVESLGPPKVVEALGLTRLECKNVETGKVGWVTMKGNQGTLYLEHFSPYNSFVKSLERHLENAAKSVSKSSSFIRQKSTELAACNQGPLVSARSELSKLKPRMSTTQKKLEDLKQALSDAKKDFVKREEAERRSQREVRERKTATVVLKSINQKVDVLDASMDKLEEALKPLISTNAKIDLVAEPLSMMKAAAKLVTVVEKDVGEVRACLALHQPTLAKAAKGPLHEAKQEVAKVMVKVEATGKKADGLMEKGRCASKAIASRRSAEVSALLRQEVQQKAITIDALFASILPKGEEQISRKAFSSYLKKLPTFKISSEHMSLLLDNFDEGGISKRSFLGLVQQYLNCVKPIAVADEFDIGKGKTQRMLEAGELVEVLEGPVEDENLGLTRVRGRALRDAITGWISVKGNRGTPFLEESSKPFKVCAAEVHLEKDFKSGTSSVVKKLQADEVLEVLEGPRKEEFGEAMRAKCKAAKDGAIGYFTVRSCEGKANAEEGDKYFICTAAIALTDAKDIKQCKVLRKLEVGEVILAQEGPMEGEGGVTRIRGKCMKDGSPGWVTVKGNAGTVYAEPSTRHYTVLAQVPLHKKFATDVSEKVRMLEKDEAVQILEGPREEKFEAVMRLKGRALSDGSTGWITVKDKNLKPWSPFYKCSSATVIHDGLSVKAAQVVRRIEAGEVVELTEGPMLEKEIGVLRIKARAETDGAVGWITVKGNQGTVFLRSFVK